MLNSSTDTITGGGLNFAGTGYLNNTLGYGIYGNVMYASYKDTSLIVLDTLIGVVFRVIRTDTFALPIAAGFYIDYPYAFNSLGVAKGFNAGAGVNITAQIKLSERIHLYGRLQGAYAVLDGGEIFVTPCIGIGF
jgi:hypothetical protein